MHAFNVATLFIVLSLVGVEFSVSAFINPAAWRLDPEPQLKLLSRVALVLGKAMPVWYPACALLLGIQTWLNWHAAGLEMLLAADALWVLASVGGIIFLVPLNSRIAAGEADWQRIHRLWDGGIACGLPLLPSRPSCSPMFWCAKRAQLPWLLQAGPASSSDSRTIA